jgi:hypothetical protein
VERKQALTDRERTVRRMTAHSVNDEVTLTWFWLHI